MKLKRSLAVASVAALGLAGLVTAPAAYALDENISLAPNTGLNSSVFLSDTFMVDVDFNSVSVNPELYDNGRLLISGLDGATSIQVATPFVTDIVVVTDGDNTVDDAVCRATLDYVIVNAVTGAQAAATAVVFEAPSITADASASNTTCRSDFNGTPAIDDVDRLVSLPFASTTGSIAINLGGGFIYDATDDEYDAAPGTYSSTQVIHFAAEDADNDIKDGDITFTIQTWIETSAATLVDANASSISTVNFYDPENVSVIARIEKFKTSGDTLRLNDAADTVLAGSLRFSRPVNLDQIDSAKWSYGIDSSIAAKDFAYADANNVSVEYAKGFSSLGHDVYGRIMFNADLDGADALAVGETYSIFFRHDEDDAATPRDYFTPGFQVLTNAGSTAVETYAGVTSTTDAGTATDLSTVTLRTGVNTFTYSMQVAIAAGTDLKSANVPVMAIVTAGSFIGSKGELTVSGATEKITRAGQALLVNGLTDADGKWSFTVTSNLAANGVTYNVDSYVLSPTTGAWVNTAADSKSSALAATYATAAATTLAKSSGVLAGADNTVTFTIQDQFGQPIAQTSTGRAYSIEFSAPDKTKLDQDAVATAGKATFAFKSWLKTGESDVLTARVYTGSATSPVFTSVTTTVMLYSVTAVTAVNVPKEQAGIVVSYVDFITGKSTTAKPGPTSGQTYSGTVIDANGAGIPGAPVTIAAKGFQFLYDGEYYIDSVTLMTTEAGTFSVSYWTNVASATGVALTATSGGKVGTTTVKSAVPTGDQTISTKNLSFTWSIPSVLVMNTTYAVTATVADKWGNGIPNAYVKFNGYGAAQFNGLAETTRSTDRNGKITVFLRSLKDVDGPSSIGAELTGIGANATDTSDFITGEGLTAIYTNAATTAWDESKWSSVVEAQVNFLKTAPIGAGKVNVGSFNGKLVVYAAGLNGARISWKVGGNWGSAVATSNYSIFNRPTPRAGVTVSVQIYVNGVLTLTKSVLTR